MGKSLTKQSEAGTGVVQMATCDSLVLEKRDYNEAWHLEEDSSPSEFDISLNLTSNVDRLKISMSWTDQGWGNRKGQLWLQLRRGGEVVAETDPGDLGLAPHTLTKVEKTLSADEGVVSMARPGDRYHVMTNVGGGGGHTLTIKDFKMTVHYTGDNDCPIKSGEGFPLEGLPDLVILQVAKHLSTDDARNLSLTCRRFHAILPIYKFPKIIRGPNIKERGPIDGNLVPSEYFRCQNLITRVGKIEMSMTWKDQGFGNRKGHIWLQLRRPKNEPNSDNGTSFDIVTEMRADHFEVAPHETSEFSGTLTEEDEVVSLARPGDYYMVMKNVGGGGGHSLTVKDFKMVLHFQPLFRPRQEDE